MMKGRWISRRGAAVGALITLMVSCSIVDTESRERAYEKAKALHGVGDDEAALVLLAEAGSSARSSLLAGKIEFMRGNSEAAEKKFREARQLDPLSIDADIWSARALRAVGREAEAAAVLAAVLERDSENVRALRMMADAAANRGDFGKAFAYLEQVLDGGNEIGLALIDRARLYWISGDAEGALADLRNARSLIPEESAPARAAAMHVRAIEGAQND